MANFWPRKNFQSKFELNLYYLLSIAAIPPDLKQKAFGSPVPDLLDATSEYYQIEDNSRN